VRPSLDSFRADLRAWIDKHVPEGLAETFDWRVRADLPGSVGRLQTQEELSRAQEHPLFKEWEQRCLEARLVCPAWPEEHGGRGWDAVQLTVLDEECYRAGVPRIDRIQGESMVGPSIILHGTDEQKARFLPPIISGEHRYCQGFSEPNAGSDLAAVTTRGVICGDDIVVNGQKLWTSRFTTANMIFILCRTDQEAPKHKGLSYVLAEFSRDNGIDVRPVRSMTGTAEFGEVFLDGVRAPLANVIGGLNNGWQVVQSTLNFERVGGGRATTLLRLAREGEFWALVDTVRAAGRAGDPVVRQQLAWAYGQVEILRFTWLRILADLEAGRDPGPEAATWKLGWSEYHARLGDVAATLAGADSLIRPAGDDYPTTRWQDVLLTAPSGRIYAGTSEIQRNIIGERTLGLPREPRASGEAGEPPQR
jgi:alkylation response protein AidB-like acyl-CoA dehydrogenase